MSTKHTISINGQLYDATTGLQVQDFSAKTVEKSPEVPAVKPEPPTRTNVHREPQHPSVHIHQNVQKSTTLRRGHLAAPTNKVPTSAPQRHVAGHITRSPMISKFASHPKPLPKNHTAKMINDIGPIIRQTTPVVVKPKKPSSVEIKEQLIAKAGAIIDHQIATKSSAFAAEKPKRTPLLKRIRSRHLVTVGISVILLAGYLAYLNIPGLSVRIAAAQSGVNAAYPRYSPDGYSFQGPVAFQQGQVDLSFKSNGGGEGYIIRQQNSNWNSIAVLDNLVSKASKGQYQANSEGGIIIYTYGTKAAWTNGGVLYTIDGKAPLNSDQLVKIASSM